ncbi:hypothetical protein CEXT_689321 [Caerostris extrusa]|uniref:Uncharacterized protein n=1 Tax=Caerostris extrusa TaxID=172846 RepID=A0AAV4RRZ5_CAEEX|nr:hypothetical protein CEXT_689321 [Caerostris extrusa]
MELPHFCFIRDKKDLNKKKEKEKWSEGKKGRPLDEEVDWGRPITTPPPPNSLNRLFPHLDLIPRSSPSLGSKNPENYLIPNTINYRSYLTPFSELRPSWPSVMRVDVITRDLCPLVLETPQASTVTSCGGNNELHRPLNSIY